MNGTCECVPKTLAHAKTSSKARELHLIRGVLTRRRGTTRLPGPFIPSECLNLLPPPPPPPSERCERARERQRERARETDPVTGARASLNQLPLDGFQVTAKPLQIFITSHPSIKDTRRCGIEQGRDAHNNKLEGGAPQDRGRESRGAGRGNAFHHACNEDAVMKSAPVKCSQLGFNSRDSEG